MYIVDWLEYTVKQNCIMKLQAMEFLADTLPDNILLDMNFREVVESKGMYRYKKRLQFSNGLLVLFDGWNQDYEMGMHVCIPSSLLHNTYTKFTDEVLVNFLGKLSSNKANLTRVDIALDTNKDYSYFLDNIRAGRFITKFRKFKGDIDLFGKFQDRGTIYLGSRGGKIFGRIYDKAKEQRLNDSTVWTRIEYEYKEDYCEQAIQAYLDGTIKELFLGHFRIIKECEKANISRDSEVDEEYMKVLMHPEEIKRISSKNKEDKYLQWIEHNVMPGIKSLQIVYGKEFVKYLINKAIPNENRLHKEINKIQYEQNRQLFQQTG